MVKERASVLDVSKSQSMINPSAFKSGGDPLVETENIASFEFDPN